jgi:hypothetical protein
MKLSLLFKKRQIWSIYIHKIPTNQPIFDCDLGHPIKTIGETGLRLSEDYHHTTADPFLFEEKEVLYLFYEVKTDFTSGEIHAMALAGDTWKKLGRVLKENFHLSYPQVFRYNDKILMIPETEESGKLYLYEAKNFPLDWRKTRTLSNHALVDTNIVFSKNGTFLIGANKQTGLSVFHADSLEGNFTCIFTEGEFHDGHSRNAGPIIEHEGELYRLFQDSSRYYGEKTGLAKITRLDRTGYSEQIIQREILENRKPHELTLGNHHYSAQKYNGHQFVAVDGLGHDRYLNTILYGYFKVRNTITSRT